MEAVTQARTCSICMEADNGHVRSCSFCKYVFCSTCVSQYVKIKILDGQVTPNVMVCPGPRCSHPFTWNNIKKLVDDDTYAKYTEFLRLRTTGVRYCPRLDCGEEIKEKRFSKTRHVFCSKCEKKSCMRCHKDYHPFGFCRRPDSSFRKWKHEKNVRHCPNCLWEIEKNGGCSHMSCSRCGHEFCWDCLKPWNRHDDLQCLPLALYHSQSRWFGPSVPVRTLTKSALASIATGVFVAGAGVGVTILPLVLAGRFVRDQVREYRYKRYLSQSFTENVVEDSYPMTFTPDAAVFDPDVAAAEFVTELNRHYYSRRRPLWADRVLAASA